MRQVVLFTLLGIYSIFELYLPNCSNSMKTLYLAKEPDAGVRDDLSRISGEITIVDCLNGYGDWYRKKGYNCISKTKYFELDGTMRFEVVIGNAPYQAPNLTGKRGKGGNNSLYIKFIERGIEVTKDGGRLSLITPPAALIKSTVMNQPTPTLKKLMESGSFDMIDLTAGEHFSVGSFICRWEWVKGKKQGKVKVVSKDCVRMMDIEDIFYLPPVFTDLELNLYKKIISNKSGDRLVVVRDKPGQDCTMERFGYPKVQIGGKGVLGFKEEHYEFLSSKLGLWLLDYVRRHDQMIYHNVLTGIHIPDGGFTLTKEELQHVNSNQWVNFSKKEHEEQTQ